MSNKGKILVIIGCLLIILSGLLIMYNNYLNENAASESRKILEKLENNLIEEEIISYEEEMKKVSIDGNDYIGILNIPALKLELPVMSDWDYNKMKKSPCRYYGSIYTNDLVICAHSYDNLFGRIKKLKKEDLITLTDMNNEEYIYKVEVIEILSPGDIEEMIESEFDLTLYTCTRDGSKRVTVRLNRV